METQLQLLTMTLASKTEGRAVISCVGVGILAEAELDMHAARLVVPVVSAAMRPPQL